MSDLTLLRDLGVIVTAAAAFVIVARLGRMPSIVAYILAGLALGPLTGVIQVTQSVELISDVGIALLLFIVGLELSLRRIREVGKVALVAGLGQVVFTAGGGLGLALLLGFDLTASIFIGTALTFSSTVLVVKLLDQKRDLHSLYGRIAVGIFLVQDLVVIVVLTLLAGLAGGQSTRVLDILSDIVLAFAGMGVLLLGAVAASRYVLPRVFGWVAGTAEILFIWGLCWCFLLVLAAEALGLSLEIGAFLAGVSLAQLPFNDDLRRRVHPLMNFFIAVFFVSLGVQLELDAAAAQWQAATALSLFVLVGNPLIFIILIAWLGYSERTSFLAGVTVAQISEFSFIFAALGLSAGLVDESVLSVIAVVGLVTFVASAYMILYNHQIYAVTKRWGVLKPFRARQVDDEAPPPPQRNHIIAVGINALGRRLVHRLVERGEKVLAVDTDPRKLLDLPCATLLGNVEYLSVLEEAHVTEAKLLVSALQIEDTNALLAHRCRTLGVPASIHAFDRSVEEDLGEIGVGHLIISKNSALRRILEALRRQGVLAP
ncbi:MAG: cation:proton antiporter [Gemmatimonadetes bacterium]|nr:cation:proton antiporter [Gemmatimonadota bacterium]